MEGYAVKVGRNLINGCGRRRRVGEQSLGEDRLEKGIFERNEQHGGGCYSESIGEDENGSGSELLTITSARTWCGMAAAYDAANLTLVRTMRRRLRGTRLSGLGGQKASWHFIWTCSSLYSRSSVSICVWLVALGCSQCVSFGNGLPANAESGYNAPAARGDSAKPAIHLV